MWFYSIVIKSNVNNSFVLHFGQYVADVRTFQKHLQEAEQAIVVINKEEDFYKLEQTHYPEFKVLKGSSDLYQRLFGLVLNWQHREKRSDFSLMLAIFNLISSDNILCPL